MKEFEQAWSRLVKLYQENLTIEDLRKGEKRAGVDPAQWAELCDRFASEHANLVAQVADDQRAKIKWAAELVELQETREDTDQRNGVLEDVARTAARKKALDAKSDEFQKTIQKRLEELKRGYADAIQYYDALVSAETKVLEKTEKCTATGAGGADKDRG